jgi:hypothetical protein
LASGNKNYAVRVSHLSDADAKRIKQTIEKFALDRKDVVRDTAIGAIPAYAESQLLVKVAGYGKVAPYVRAAPGAKRIVDVLGKESFQLFGAFLAVGLQAYEDSQRSDLDGAQRLGRASTALLTAAVGAEFPPLGILLIGLAIAFPDKYDAITAAAFTDRDPVVQWLGGVIVKVGGKPFQQWAAKPSLLDFY